MAEFSFFSKDNSKKKTFDSFKDCKVFSPQLDFDEDERKMGDTQYLNYYFYLIYLLTKKKHPKCPCRYLWSNLMCVL